MFITPLLDQDAQNVTVLINGAPKVMLHTTHRDINFIKILGIGARPWSAPNHIGEILSELKTPLTNCFVRYGDDPCIEQFVKLKVNRKYSHTA